MSGIMQLVQYGIFLSILIFFRKYKTSLKRVLSDPMR
jgi:hypothetical protein